MARAIQAVALAALLSPALALADRGALTLDAGPVMSGMRLPPGAGKGAAVSGTVGGISLGIRYALRNDLELSVRGEWFKPAPFFQDGTTVTTPDGVFVGQAQARVGRQGASLGVHWVHGLVWRLQAGVDAGWMRLSYESVDLVDVSDPGTPRTFGLALGSPVVNSLVVSPGVGAEWGITDHAAISLGLRLDLVTGRRELSGLSIPILFSWSWYGLR